MAKNDDVKNDYNYSNHSSIQREKPHKMTTKKQQKKTKKNRVVGGGGGEVNREQNN